MAWRGKRSASTGVECSFARSRARYGLTTRWYLNVGIDVRRLNIVDSCAHVCSEMNSDASPKTNGTPDHHTEAVARAMVTSDVEGRRGAA